MVMYVMMCGEMPFYSEVRDTLFDLIVKVRQGMGDVFLENASPVGRGEVSCWPIRYGQVFTKETARERSKEMVGEEIRSKTGYC